eukprot:TRINITY_DN10621_c1_g1_i1.p1 TRINITY_DN10621_c1_g1~~TRINITY_DN10621_c1_g1_i1.p1  ORF type:complete len:641 (+),score=178.52 TRINITY_DN10621_c1_g1_i1:133-2055(+)
MSPPSVERRRPRLRLEVYCDETRPGDGLFLCGEADCLGAWDVKKALALQTSSEEYPAWTLQIEPPPTNSSFKFFIRRPDGQCAYEVLRWHGNRSWPVAGSEEALRAGTGGTSSSSSAPASRSASLNQVWRGEKLAVARMAFGSGQVTVTFEDAAAHAPSTPRYNTAPHTPVRGLEGASAAASLASPQTRSAPHLHAGQVTQKDTPRGIAQTLSERCWATEQFTNGSCAKSGAAAAETRPAPVLEEATPRKPEEESGGSPAASGYGTPSRPAAYAPLSANWSEKGSSHSSASTAAPSEASATTPWQTQKSGTSEKTPSSSSIARATPRSCLARQASLSVERRRSVSFASKVEKVQFEKNDSFSDSAALQSPVSSQEETAAATPTTEALKDDAGDSDKLAPEEVEALMTFLVKPKQRAATKSELLSNKLRPRVVRDMLVRSARQAAFLAAITFPDSKRVTLAPTMEADEDRADAERLVEAFEAAASNEPPRALGMASPGLTAADLAQDYKAARLRIEEMKRRLAARSGSMDETSSDVVAQPAEEPSAAAAEKMDTSPVVSEVASEAPEPVPPASEAPPAPLEAPPQAAELQEDVFSQSQQQQLLRLLGSSKGSQQRKQQQQQQQAASRAAGSFVLRLCSAGS